MIYKLFLDDERFPVEDGGKWIICRTVEDAIWTVEHHGLPSFISFDNDLGEGQDEGRLFARWFVEYLYDFTPDQFKEFDFYVHSQNPVARECINSLLTDYLNHRRN